MVISKDKAKMIAKELCKKHFSYKELLDKKFNNEVKEAYNKSVPLSVKRLQKVHPDYFRYAVTIYFEGHGFSHTQVRIEGNVINNSGNYYAILKLSSELAKRLQLMKRECDKANEDYKKLIKEVEVALIGLKTYKRITDKFPEAAKLLPAAETLALVINVDEVRSKLSKAV